MLEHQKIVLEALLEHKERFEMELLKSFKWLDMSEQMELIDWLKHKGCLQYNSEVIKCHLSFN